MANETWAIIGGIKYPTYMDAHNVQRFTRNRAVCLFVDAARGGRMFDLNSLAIARANGDVSLDECAELYRLLGTSVSGLADMFPDAGVDSNLWWPET